MDRIQFSRALATALMLSTMGAGSLSAQFLDYGRAGFGGGIQAGGVLGQTELRDKADAQVRVHLSHGLTERVSAQVGVGYLALSGDEYDTDIGQADVRLEYSLHPMRRISPFAYAGVGALRYDLAGSSRRTDDAAAIGWSTVVPLGLGVKFKVSRRIALQAGAGYTHTFRDDINSAILGSGSDVYWGLRLGLEFGADPDPDRDGLFALAEKRAGSDPRRLDTDGDGLTDDQEVRLGTNPASRDSDGDGSLDWVEVSMIGRDPVRADAPAPEPVAIVQPAPEPARTVVIEAIPDFTDLRFAFGRSNLNDVGITEVERLVDLLHDRQDLVVDLRGHTDDVGQRAANLRVAGRRANHVKSLLVARGVDGHRVLTSAVGPDEPVATNHTAAGREANRRIEIVIVSGAM